MSVVIDPTGALTPVLDDRGVPLPVDPPTEVVRLAAGGAEAVLYPAAGFNLIDWRVQVDGAPVRLIVSQPDVLSGGRPTRSGMPILFPFPNRIAGAVLPFEGRSYRLPPRSAEDPNAIHGFTPMAAWPECTAVGDSAVSATFRVARDAAQQIDPWPGDLQLVVTFDLAPLSLRVSAEVANLGDEPAPFGLGFHPYFATLGAGRADDVVLSCDAGKRWILNDGIPTGMVRDVEGDDDLREPSRLRDRTFDDVLTGLSPFAPDADALMTRARLSGPAGLLELRCDEQWRDLVVYTPAARDAIAIEPYTCPTDAAHLAESGRDVGWRVLAPNEQWRAGVEFRFRPAAAQV